VSFDELAAGIATALAIASFLYGLAGILVLLDDDNPGKWVKIAIWLSVSWPVLFAIGAALLGWVEA